MTAQTDAQQFQLDYKRRIAAEDAFLKALVDSATQFNRSKSFEEHARSIAGGIVEGLAVIDRSSSPCSTR